MDFLTSIDALFTSPFCLLVAVQIAPLPRRIRFGATEFPHPPARTTLRPDPRAALDEPPAFEE